MSAYMFEDADLETAGDHLHAFGYGGAAPPAPLERRLFASDFVCNVSQDDTVERDIDLEIEARIRSLTFLSDEETSLLSLSMASLSTAPTNASAHTPELPRTMSQRMLSSLNKAKLSQSQRSHRSVSSSVPQQKTYATSMARSAAETRAAPVRSERSFYAIDETPTLESASRGRGDSHSTQLSGRSASSCTDRLEARISKSFLDRQDSSDSSADPNDLSVMYSGRRTYPAESVKKPDLRLSENTPLPAQQDTRMMTALEKERKALALAGLDGLPRRVEPEIDNSRRSSKKSDQGVSFHFQGGSSFHSSAASGALTRKPRPALVAPESFSPPQHQQSLAMVVPSRQSSSELEPKYTVLAGQLGDIETLIDGIETCMTASSSTFSSMAIAVLGELELLKGATAQIRKNGATLILAEAGRPLTETVNALRRLVTRAAAVQIRIESIMMTTSSML
ncbi:hypothetical protein PybrP1_011035 [[Pythium] brassicae (nom. inval.)]|nr:hypothetical protein PybrP1_011035 [[Pythium] brassicae (nom. inval.)]